MDFSKLSDEQLKVAKEVRDAAREAGIDEELALTAAFHGSRFHSNDVSVGGGVGVFQINPDVAHMYELDPNDIKGSVKLLQRSLDLQGDPIRAIVSIKEGPGSKFLESGDLNDLSDQTLMSLKDINQQYPIFPKPQEEAPVAEDTTTNDQLGAALVGAGAGVAGGSLVREAPLRTPSTIGLENKILRNKAVMEDIRREISGLAPGETPPRVEPRVGGQTAFERGIQGAPEESFGTTGRARQETYNTETARRAALAKGERSPFTSRTWGATPQGVLAPPELVAPAVEVTARAETEAAKRAALEAELERKMRMTRRSEAELEALRKSMPWLARAGSMFRSPLAKAIPGAAAGLGVEEVARYWNEDDPLKAAVAALGTTGALSLAAPAPIPALKAYGMVTAPISLGGLKLIDYLRAKGYLSRP